MSAKSPPECTQCGCCCFSQESTYIRVFEVDAERMDERALALTTVIDGERYMTFTRGSRQGEGGHCVALQVTDGYRCAIYPMRPDACRWLERGSGECLRQIDVKGQVAQSAAIRIRRRGSPQLA